MDKTLDGLRVIEYGEGEALAMAGRFLAELGAEVIKVEPPEGDNLRKLPPLLQAGEDTSSYLFEMLNIGKRSVVLDVNKTEDRNDLKAMIADADIFLESHQKLSEMKRLGLDYDGVKDSNDALIYTSISGFGLTGPYVDRPWSDIVIQAVAGSMYMMGYEEDPPTKSGPSYIDYATAMWAVNGTMVALYSRDDTALGQLVEIAAIDAADATDGNVFHQMLHAKRLTPRSGTSHPTSTPYGVFPSKDGFVATGVSGDPQWALLCKAMGREELIEDPRCAHGYERINVNTDWTNQQVIDWTSTIDSKDLVDILLQYKLAAGAVQTVDQVVKDEQFTMRDMVYDAKTEYGDVYAPGSIFAMTKTRGQLSGVAPKKGEAKASDFIGNHTIALPTDPQPIEPGRKPLEGLNVLDFGRYLAAPLLGIHLAAFGAKVVKVEPTAIDAICLQPPFIEGSTRNAIFQLLDSGLEDMCVNMASEEGQQIIKDMVSNGYSVVIENNSTSVMRKYHSTYDDLKKYDDDLIYASLSGYGQEGPKSKYLAMDQMVQCEAGILSLNGWETPKFTRVADSFSDTIMPAVAMICILASLHYRRRTGVGQHIDMSMMDVDGFLSYCAWPALFTEGKVLKHLGNTYPFAVAYNGYNAKDDMVVIGVTNDAEWTALLDAMGSAADGLKAAIPTPADRFNHATEIDAAINAWVADQDAAKVVETLTAVGVPAAVPVNLLEHLNDPIMVARETHLEKEHPNHKIGKIYTLNTPLKLSKTPGRVEGVAPEFGEDTQKILVGELGKSQDEVTELRQSGAVL